MFVQRCKIVAKDTFVRERHLWDNQTRYFGIILRDKLYTSYRLSTVQTIDWIVSSLLQDDLITTISNLFFHLTTKRDRP